MQSYKSIVDEMEMTGDLWVDEEFGRNDQAIRGDNSGFLPDNSKFQWKRARDTMTKPVLFQGVIEPNDITQG